MKLRLYIIILFSCFCINAGAVTLNDAKALVTAGDYTRAVVAFRSLIQQPRYANNAEINKFYGQCLCMTGEYAESVKYLEKGAKGGKIGAYWYLGISRQHLYDFEGAIESLEKYKAGLSKNSTWIPRTDSIISECEIGLRAVGHVQDVVIIDSLMVPQTNFFSYYKLGFESGKMISPEECGGVIAERSDSSAVVFETLAGDYRLLTLDDKENGTSNLYASSFFEGRWTEPEKIESIGGESCRVAYPFMRTDGETLYFACDSTPGMGGLDIYVTTFNAEADAFYAPSRLSMPFNSPYNDYMMAIDETNHVGWWATDRGAKPGFVCIYLFKIDDEPSFLEGDNVSRARIDCIADTWREDNYDELLEQIKNPVDPHAVAAAKLFIPIRDNIVYESADDFKNEKARRAYDNYCHAKENLTIAKTDLQQLREDYRNANASVRSMLRPQILQKEIQVNNLHEQIARLAKEYRNLEN